jgi:ketosteroid isomerase-like protein
MESGKKISPYTLSEKQLSEIKAEVKQAALAHLHAKDAATALSHYRQDATIVSNGFLYPSFQSFAEHIKQFYGSLSRVNLAAWDEIYINVLTVDTAVFTAKFSWSSTATNGVKTDLQGVWTALFIRDKSGWRISLRHESFIPLKINI